MGKLRVESLRLRATELWRTLRKAASGRMTLGELWGGGAQLQNEILADSLATGVGGSFKFSGA
jgi:hypothetical protein